MHVSPAGELLQLQFPLHEMVEELIWWIMKKDSVIERIGHEVGAIICLTR